jgi:hypothetical protein
MSLTSYLPVQVIPSPPSFRIRKMPNGGEDSYFIDNGVCFSTFSYETGTFVPIKGLGSGYNYNFTNDKKFYIDFEIAPNLQVSSAEIKCEPAPGEDTWPNYPNIIEIKPTDELDEKGNVIKLIDNKKQIACRVLIGYKANDKNKNGDQTQETENVKKPVQILNTDFILLASVLSGVPVVFPMPYLNGQAHLNAIVKYEKTDDE